MAYTNVKYGRESRKFYVGKQNISQTRNNESGIFRGLLKSLSQKLLADKTSAVNKANKSNHFAKNGVKKKSVTEKPFLNKFIYMLKKNTSLRFSILSFSIVLIAALSWSLHAKNVFSKKEYNVASLPSSYQNGKKFANHIPGLESKSYVIIDKESQKIILAKNEDDPRSIASISKLLFAIVYLDMLPDLSEEIEILSEDRKGARPAVSRLQLGWKLTAHDLLYAALVASENPAVEALVRSTGLSRPEFVGMMNRKAQELGMTHSIFFDASGLDANNTASAKDVATLLSIASTYPAISEISTTEQIDLKVRNSYGKTIHYWNSNRLARMPKWDVTAGKTGYISDSGYCLAVSAKNESGRELLMIFLGAPANSSRFKDAERVSDWLKRNEDSTNVYSYDANNSGRENI